VWAFFRGVKTLACKSFNEHGAGPVSSAGTAAGTAAGTVAEMRSRRLGLFALVALSLSSPTPAAGGGAVDGVPAALRVLVTTLRKTLSRALASGLTWNRPASARVYYFAPHSGAAMPAHKYRIGAVGPSDSPYFRVQ
jgi:hypothetical protein